jgi:hypothetical protein
MGAEDTVGWGKVQMREVAGIGDWGAAGRDRFSGDGQQEVSGEESVGPLGLTGMANAHRGLTAPATQSIGPSGPRLANSVPRNTGTPARRAADVPSADLRMGGRCCTKGGVDGMCRGLRFPNDGQSPQLAPRLRFRVGSVCRGVRAWRLAFLRRGGWSKNGRRHVPARRRSTFGLALAREATARIQHWAWRCHARLW